MKKPSPEKVDAILAKEIDIDVVKTRLEPHWKNGRRPGFWDNDDAFRAAVLLYKRANILDAADIINERFGAGAVSKSAVSRFWKHVLSKAVAAGLVI